MNEAANRVAMHAVRRELLELQADAAGLPLWPINLPWPCSNEQYERIMRGVLERAVAEGVEAIAFGDLFLAEREFAGREFDAALLAELPAPVDPCGENGEFHTFAYAGPMFSRAIPVTGGEVVERNGFVFADLVSSSLPVE